MTERTEEELQSYARLHDFDDPQSELSKLEMIYAAVTAMPTCLHCAVDYRPLPMAGTAWGIEHIHEPGCPTSEETG